MIEEIVNIIVNNGVSVGVLVFLLWERSKTNDTLIKTLQELKDTTNLIKEYFIDTKNIENDSK